MKNFAASLWCNHKQTELKSQTCGFKIKAKNPADIISEGTGEIELILRDEPPRKIKITDSFWSGCTEFRHTDFCHMRCSVIQGFSGTVVEFFHDSLNLIFRYVLNATPLSKVLSDQSIDIFI
jgi:hypothetical protein